MNCCHKNVNVITYYGGNITIGHQLNIFYYFVKCKGRPSCSVIPANWWAFIFFFLYNFVYNLVTMTRLLLILFSIFTEKLFFSINFPYPLQCFLQLIMCNVYLPLNFSHKNVIIDGAIYDRFWLLLRWGYHQNHYVITIIWTVSLREKVIRFSIF